MIYYLARFNYCNNYMFKCYIKTGVCRLPYFNILRTNCNVHQLKHLLKTFALTNKSIMRLGLCGLVNILQFFSKDNLNTLLCNG